MVSCGLIVTTTPDKFCLVGHVMLLHLERLSWCFLCYFCFPFVVSLCLFFLFSGFLGFSRLLFLLMVTCCFAFVLAWSF
ncbi:hypothetical protein ACE6H2_018805 [Prunus campanulata]